MVIFTMNYPKIISFGLYLLLMKTGLSFCEYQSFTLAFMENRDYSENLCDNDLLLYLTATEMTECLISAPKTLKFFEQRYTVNPNDVIKVTLPRFLALSGSGVQQKGIDVSCNSTITLYGINACLHNTDGFSVIPNSHLGREYYAFTFSPTSSQSQVAIVSYIDNTTVSIKLRCTECKVTFDNVDYMPESVITVVLNAYECSHFQSDGNLAGAYISSNNPVSVFSGNVRTGLNEESGKEHLVLHIPPIPIWGKQFAVVPTLHVTRDTLVASVSDILFLMASADFTNCSIICSSGSGAPTVHHRIVNAGQIIQKDILSGQYCSIETNETVLAVQMISPETEPSFLLLTPINRYSTNYLFMTPNASTGSSFKNYFVYVIEESAAADLILDSNAIQINTRKIPGTTLLGGCIAVTDNIHHVTHSYVFFYGAIFGVAQWESYAVSLGWNWKDLTVTSNPIPELLTTEQLSQSTINGIQMTTQATQSTFTAMSKIVLTKQIERTGLSTIIQATTGLTTTVQTSQSTSTGSTTIVQASQGTSAGSTTTVQSLQGTFAGSTTNVRDQHVTSTGSPTTTQASQGTSVVSTTTDQASQGTYSRSTMPGQDFQGLTECQCPCASLSTELQEFLRGKITKEELVRLVLSDFEQTIKPSIMVDRTKLSLTKRKKISVMNNDTTAHYIGWGFSWIVVTPIALAVLSDILNLCRYCARRMRQNV